MSWEADQESSCPAAWPLQSDLWALRAVAVLPGASHRPCPGSLLLHLSPQAAFSFFSMLTAPSLKGLVRCTVGGGHLHIKLLWWFSCDIVSDCLCGGQGGGRRGVDSSPPGSSVRGIFQAKILEWFPFPSPRDLPRSGMEPVSPALTDSLPLSYQRNPQIKLGYLNLLILKLSALYLTS